MRRQESRSRDAFPKRRLIALVSRVEKVGEGERGRTSFEFDALDEKAADHDIGQLFESEDTLPFASLRILTTTRHFARVFDRIPRIGDWYELLIEPIKPSSGPRLSAWHAQLSDDGYNSHTRGYAVAVRFLFGGEDVVPGELSAAVDPGIARGRRVAKAASFPAAAIAARTTIRSVLKKIQRPTQVVVHDVGQAAFVSLTESLGKPLIHYDAGWPISYNRHTALRKTMIRCEGAPVILSHWDWDHMHGYYRFPETRLSQWIVPVQKFGPGAARVVTKLHLAGKLIGFQGGPMTFKWGLIGLSKGAEGNNNQTGLAVRLQLTCGRLGLLVGDADYQNLPRAMLSTPLNFLVFTHHGADFDGPVPTSSTGDNCCVVSYGKRNTYKHPKRFAIQQHKTGGWDPMRTAAYGRTKRGDRLIP
jgi:beta-lactamase superfamily II metal-dependent hydrolase